MGQRMEARGTFAERAESGERPSGERPGAVLSSELLKDQRVKVAITDLDGVLRGKYLQKEKFLSAADSGFGFCNVVFGWDLGDACYDGAEGYTGWHTGYPDALVRIDPGTCRRIPWEDGVPFFLGDFEDNAGRGLPVCPRQLLKKVIARAESAGFRADFGLEFEWFNFRETPRSLAEKGYRDPEPLTPGMFGYSILRSSQNQPFFTALMEQLRAFRVPLEGFHSETGPGVLEAALVHGGALETADRGALFKSAVKEIGHRFGIMPSFMAKWNSRLPGCSGHAHQSLWDLAGTRNLFHDPLGPHRMSAIFRGYLAGLLHCLPEILPLFAPTVNSYKRLVEGYWAPTRPCWGLDNRTVAFRVIPGSPSSTRVEARVPGADVNPYLAIAGCLASGLYGVERKLELNELPVRGSAYAECPGPRLPRTLLEATERMARSELARELLGSEFVEHFTRTRLWEWRQFQDSVTQWELERYFEII
ncbi:MAG: glutamine synthetase family protein [Oligoflexia bacterium]|nr:glutamine synthetase family protein [Oligoflexia bacterium]